MKLNINVDMEDLIGTYEPMEETIKEFLDAEIMKIVKKDIRYKSYIQSQAAKLLENLGK